VHAPPPLQTPSERKLQGQADSRQEIAHVLLGWWWALGELDTLADVAFETLDGCLDEFLLVLICTAENVDGLLCTGCTKLDWDGEEIAASLLSNGITTRNTWQIDECWLDDTALALVCPKNTFGESRYVRWWDSKQEVFRPETSVGHGKSSGTCTILCLDNLVTTKLNSIDQGV